MTIAVASAPARRVELPHFGSVEVRQRPCPSCGRDNDAVPPGPYSEGIWNVKDCPACGFVYIDAAPDYAAQSEQLAWERTTKVEEQRRAELRPISYNASKNTRARMRILPRRTMEAHIERRIDGGAVLDLGCGEGLALMKLPEAYTPYGIEISAELAARADRLFRARGGHAVNAPSLDGLRRFPDGFFAAATLRSYLEHEQHPRPVLEALRRVLAPAGFAVVKVPNYGSWNRMAMGKRWCGFRYPDHLNYFTPASLRRLAAAAGFRTRFGVLGALPTSDNMWAVLEPA